MKRHNGYSTKCNPWEQVARHRLNSKPFADVKPTVPSESASLTQAPGQAVEAGANISAAVLFTELAP